MYPGAGRRSRRRAASCERQEAPPDDVAQRGCPRVVTWHRRAGRSCKPQRRRRPRAGSAGLGDSSALRVGDRVLDVASPIKVGSVVIDCVDFETMMAFWQEALHYAPRRPPTEDWVILADPEGANVNVSLQKQPANRM